MNQKFKKTTKKKVLTLFLYYYCITPAFAQGGATASSNAAMTSKIIGIPLN
jgi:hypothetical protein